jgi:hypothetical protein
MLGFTHGGASALNRLGLTERVPRRRERFAYRVEHRPLNGFPAAL